MQVAVHADHTILGGADCMALVDSQSLELIALAIREENWSVRIGGEVHSANNRSEAIDVMLNRAVEILPGTGYSTFIPTGLRELP
jgi:hypothetical protein